MTDRAEQLVALLRETETEHMTTDEIVALCSREVPGCSIPEMIAALRESAAGHQREADALNEFFLSVPDAPAGDGS